MRTPAAEFCRLRRPQFVDAKTDVLSPFALPMNKTTVDGRSPKGAAYSTKTPFGQVQVSGIPPPRTAQIGASPARMVYRVLPPQPAPRRKSTIPGRHRYTAALTAGTDT